MKQYILPKKDTTSVLTDFVGLQSGDDKSYVMYIIGHEKYYFQSLGIYQTSVHTYRTVEELIKNSDPEHNQVYVFDTIQELHLWLGEK